MTKPDFSKIPSVDILINSSESSDLISEFGRSLVLEAIREILKELRGQVSSRKYKLPDQSIILKNVEQKIKNWVTAKLFPVINATGVILHTNLGRSPISKAASEAMAVVSQSYSTLEFDIQKGKRGSRYIHSEDQLIRLTGAESAMVVNNNAAALLLILSALARRRRVLISRTQLIEIGGGFRIPEVLKQSGAILEEIGSTNKVHLRDYQIALNELPIGLVLRAHQSNFKIIGFSDEPSTKDIAEITHEAGLILVDDLGSGTFLDTARFGLEHETTIQEALAAGADIVCFSGDKLLGGPQAGIILGKKKLIDKLKKHPIARAIRADKAALAGLSATLMHYLKDEVESSIPIWQMISMDVDFIKKRVEKWIEVLNQGELIQGHSAVGGGSLPGELLQTYLLSIKVEKPEKLMKQLRAQKSPIIARVQENRVLFDPRTILDHQENDFLSSLQKALQ